MKVYCMIFLDVSTMQGTCRWHTADVCMKIQAPDQESLAGWISGRRWTSHCRGGENRAAGLCLCFRHVLSQWSWTPWDLGSAWTDPSSRHATKDPRRRGEDAAAGSHGLCLRRHPGRWNGRCMGRSTLWGRLQFGPSWAPRCAAIGSDGICICSNPERSTLGALKHFKHFSYFFTCFIIRNDSMIIPNPPIHFNFRCLNKNNHRHTKTTIPKPSKSQDMLSPGAPTSVVAPPAS